MHLSVAGVAMLSLTLATVCLGEIPRGHYVEIFSNTRDHVMVRTKRSSEVCKYKKGTWSQCDKLVMLMTREDTLKEKNSGASCDKVRTITKNCKDKVEKNGGICVFEKPKNVAWSECKDAGVRQRVLHLVKEKGDRECPKEKIMSKKCKDDKKNKKHEANHVAASAEKCSFGGWAAWSPCENNKKQRSREILKGKERKICVKDSNEKTDC